MRSQATAEAARWGRRETAMLIWVALALASLLPAASLLRGSFPIFTAIWLLGPLAAVLQGKDAA